MAQTQPVRPKHTLKKNTTLTGHLFLLLKGDQASWHGTVFYLKKASVLWCSVAFLTWKKATHDRELRPSGRPRARRSKLFHAFLPARFFVQITLNEICYVYCGRCASDGLVLFKYSEFCMKATSSKFSTNCFCAEKKQQCFELRAFFRDSSALRIVMRKS